MTLLTFITIVIMVSGYGIAFIMIARIFMVAITLHTEVPFVPSDMRSIKASLKALELKDGDRVIDIGSGDGKFILYAARKYKNVQFTGLELNKGLVFYSKVSAKLMRLKNVRFIQGDAFKHDLSEYNRVYIYLVSTFVTKLMSKFENELPLGAKVVSVHFGFGQEIDSMPSITHIPVDKLSGKDRISVWSK